MARRGRRRSEELLAELRPKLNRYARAARDFEATSKYVERSFRKASFGIA